MEESKPMGPPAAYVNFLKVGSQASELFLSFGQLAGRGDAAHLVAALVTSPAHAKAMSQALASAVAQYEEKFGAIPGPAPQVPAAGAARAPAPPRRARKAAK